MPRHVREARRAARQEQRDYAAGVKHGTAPPDWHDQIKRVLPPVLRLLLPPRAWIIFLAFSWCCITLVLLFLAAHIYVSIAFVYVATMLWISARGGSYWHGLCYATGVVGLLVLMSGWYRMIRPRSSIRCVLASPIFAM